MVPIRRFALAPLLALALLLTLAAPGSAEGMADALAERPKVVVSIFPLHAIAAGVMAGAGSPELLLDARVSPHDFALKPSQARLLQAADLVIWVGERLEFPLARSLANLPAARSLGLAAGEDTHGHNADHGHDADRGHAAVHEDPHIWLDPRAAKEIAAAIAGRLGALDPDYAARYAENAARLAVRLDALEAELADILRPAKGIPFIVYHDAYGPFEHRFGLENLGAVTAHPENPPSAARIRRMRDIAAEHGARCLFREPQFEPRATAAITEGNAIRIGDLDPLGVGLEPGINGYFLLLRHLARNYAACLVSRQKPE